MIEILYTNGRGWTPLIVPVELTLEDVHKAIDEGGRWPEVHTPDYAPPMFVNPAHIIAIREVSE